MKLRQMIRVARVNDRMLRKAAKNGDWVATKYKKAQPRTGDPHPKGGIYIARSSVQGVREGLPFLVNDDVLIGRVLKTGPADPGQRWLVEVTKPGINSMRKDKDDTWTIDPTGGMPGAIIVHTLEDQLTWTGDAYDSFDEGVAVLSGLVNPKED